MSSHWLLTTQFDGCKDSHGLFDNLNKAKITFKKLVKEYCDDEYTQSEFDDEFDENIYEKILNGNLILYKYDIDSGSHSPSFTLVPFDINKLNIMQSHFS